MTEEGDIPRQWHKFMEQEILQTIPNKTSANIYALYSDYTGDRDGEYSFLVGALVTRDTAPPPGMIAKRVRGGRYAVVPSAAGDLTKVVPEAWQTIWKLEDEGKLKRAYQTDFEIYDQRAHDPYHAQVDIYVGLK